MKLSKVFLLCSSLFAPFRFYIFLLPLLFLNIFPSLRIPKEYLRNASICFITLSFALIFGQSINFGMYSDINIVKIFSEFFSTGRFFFLIIIFSNSLNYFYKDSYQNIFNKLEKIFISFLVLNSLSIFIFILFPQLGDIVGVIYNYGNENIILSTYKFRSQGLVVGFEYSAFACISLSILGLIKNNKFYTLLGILSSSGTGRFGILMSLFLILIILFNSSKKIIFDLIFYYKLSKKQISIIFLSFLSIFVFLYLITFLTSSIIGQSLSINEIFQIFTTGSFISENDSITTRTFDYLGYSSYDVFSRIFESRIGIIELLIGSGDSSINYVDNDSGWFRLLAKGGVLFLISILMTFYHLINSLIHFSLKLIKDKYLLNSLNFYIFSYTGLFFLLNSKSLAIISSFTLDIYLITLLIMVNNFLNFKNLEKIQKS